MKIAIVHEMLIKLGGAEKVVENWFNLFPNADIFTLMYDESKVGRIFPLKNIHAQVFKLKTQKIYQFTKKQRLSLPYMSGSIESLDLSEYDVVLISSSGFAHGVITKPETKTIVYYHAPARYMWDWTNEFKRDIRAQNGIKGYLLNSLFLKLRQWDFIASKRHDITLTNSKTTQKRVQKYFRLESEILYPPIETERFSQANTSLITPVFSKYYIILSALTEFKKIDIAIQAFKGINNAHLLIIGEGEYRKKLEEMSLGMGNIAFVGAQYGNDLVSYVQQSNGLIFPGEEDFGIVPIEVMAAGKPIFALKKGGLTETVIEGETGEFFDDPNGKDFIEKFQIFHSNNTAGKYTSNQCIKQAQKFDKKLFEKRILEIVHGDIGDSK